MIRLASSVSSHNGTGEIGYEQGCGAFDGNRVLMAMLQILAAEMAGVDRLVFQTGGPGGAVDLDGDIDQLNSTLVSAGSMETRELIDQVAGLGFTWGINDGN